MLWKDEYAVGVEEIDTQHRRLVGCFTQIEEAILHDREAPEIRFLLGQLHRFAKEHFDYEEKLMYESGYLSLPTHRAEHQSFLERLEKIEAQLTQKPFEDEAFILFQLHLQQHIQGADLDFAECFLRRAKRLSKPSSAE